MSNLNLIFNSLSLPIKIEQTFGKLSILIGPRQSKERENVSSYKFALNQDYQKIINIWQVINSH